MGTGVLLAAVALLALAALLVLVHGVPQPPDRPAQKTAKTLPAGISPREFEQHCADLLAARGWSARVGRGSADQGVDVLARKGGRSVVLQCKLYSRPVGNKAVQEALAGRGYAGADGAAVVSNATYTAAAHALAARVGVLLLHTSDLARADTLFRFEESAAAPAEAPPAPARRVRPRRPLFRPLLRPLLRPSWSLPAAPAAAALLAGVILLMPRSAPDAPTRAPRPAVAPVARPALPLPPAPAAELQRPDPSPPSRARRAA